MSSNSVFLSSDQTETNSVAHSAAPTSTQRVFTVGDAAKKVVASITTVKRIATELRLNILQTESGVWLFSEDQIEKIKRERERRAVEAARNAGGRR